MSNLARPSSSKPPSSPQRQPTRLQILKHSKGYAGEHNDLTSPDATFSLHKNTIHYTGHLPGLHSAIGTSYSTLVKKSGMFLEGKGTAGWGGPCAPISDATHDKWGSMKPLPDQLKRDVANMYLQAAHPSMPIDTTVGVGCSPHRHREGPSLVSQRFFPHTVGGGSSDGLGTSSSPQRSVGGGGGRNGAMAFTPTRMGAGRGGCADSSRPGSAIGFSPMRSGNGNSASFGGSIPRSPSRLGGGEMTATHTPPIITSERVPIDQPRHIAGYKGFMPGTRHTYGENFNRIDSRAQQVAAVHGPGGKGVTKAVTIASPARHYGEYEAHNLVVANRNAVTH